MPYSILLIVKQHEQTNNVVVNEANKREYDQSVNTIEAIAKQNGAVQSLGQGVVQLRLGGSLKGVSDVIAAIGSLPYTYTISPEDARWHGVTKAD